MAAMWVAAHHPDRVDRLVLCCTAPQMPAPEALIARAAQVRSSGTVSLLPMLMDRWFTTGYRQRQARLAGTVTAMLEAADPVGYAACCEAIAAMDQWADLDRITAPTLIIAGAEDPVAPPNIALRMHQAIRGAALTVLADSAHLANIEQAVLFTSAALGHLAGVDIERGEAVRRAVLGDDFVDQAAGATSTFVAPFIEFITRYAWGDVWTRPGLDRRTRSAITLALLAALGRTDELAAHVAGAVRNGLSPDEIGEILLQTAVYAGVPAARTALLVADRVLRDDAGG
jgi:3-oxoadipate enol-lactonase/4-carboxymuconolactone decarboxylase